MHMLSPSFRDVIDHGDNVFHRRTNVLTLSNSGQVASFKLDGPRRKRFQAFGHIWREARMQHVISRKCGLIWCLEAQGTDRIISEMPVQAGAESNLRDRSCLVRTNVALPQVRMRRGVASADQLARKMYECYIGRGGAEKCGM